ncbi:MAG: FecCD family ABC transporter permease [Anaerolineales bacterium]
MATFSSHPPAAPNTGLGLPRAGWGVLWAVLLSIALVFIALTMLTTGELALEREAVLRVLFISQDDIGDADAVPFFIKPFATGASATDRIAHVVVHDLRLPRALLGGLVGAAMALAGVMLQDTLRNPLAEPGIMGISAGAVLGVAIVTILHIPVPAGALPWIALIGGFASGTFLMIAAAFRLDSTRLVLVGASITAFVNAGLVVLISIGEPYDIQLFYRFLVGSLANRSWDAVHQILPWLVVLMPLALLSARVLNLLQLGDDVAEGLGLPVLKARLAILAISVGLVAAVVSIAGPISFISLIAPHTARRLLRTHDARLVLPIAALLGAVLLSAADLFAHTVAAPVELPVGIFTTVFGAPVLLVLLRRELRKVG